MLRVDDIHSYYGDTYVLQGVSLAIEPGQVVAVLGRNGVGKTTLVRSIIGITPPRSGRIFFRGTNISRLPAHQIARLGIGLIPQGRRMFPSLTVKEHLTVTAHSSGDGTWDFDRVINLFPNLGRRLQQSGSKLSGGEQQMLATGRALVSNPDLLLMDEPTEGLAPIIVRELGAVIDALKSSGTSILLVEQQLAFAMRHADRIYIMSKGRIVHHCSPDELAADRETKARYLGV
jgi:branched-chain amino acid transport system ATP-binding protein